MVRYSLPALVIEALEEAGGSDTKRGTSFFPPLRSPLVEQTARGRQRRRHQMLEVSELLVVLGRPIAFYPGLVRATGSVTAALFLCQLIYWTPRSQDPDGWIYKTQDDIVQETALSRYEQESARRNLRDRKLIEEHRRGNPSKLYYRVCLETLNRSFRMRDSSMLDSTMVDSYNAANPHAVNPHSNKKDSESTKDQERPDVENLCNTLADLIEQNGSKRPTISKAWRDETRRMLDIDKRPLAEARRLIAWCQRDSFWRANVLSMSKFRAKYDQLRLQEQRDRAVAATPSQRSGRQANSGRGPIDPGPSYRDLPPRPQQR